MNHRWTQLHLRVADGILAETCRRCGLVRCTSYSGGGPTSRVYYHDRTMQVVVARSGRAKTDGVPHNPPPCHGKR